MSACLSDILLKVLNGSLIKIKPICYVTVAPITLCFMIDDFTTKTLTLILLPFPPAQLCKGFPFYGIMQTYAYLSRF